MVRSYQPVAASQSAFSPHAWGWSDVPIEPVPGVKVLPTRVGMVRLSRPIASDSGRSPHTRGDGPAIIEWNSWFLNVLPTPVGLVRIPTRSSSFPGCSPHTRGDGP